MIGMLQALRASLESPMNHMNTTADADPLLPGVHMSRQGIEGQFGLIPLPEGHPKYEAIVGALFAAMGAIDETIEYEQEIKQKAVDAVAAIQQAMSEIDAAIQGFQQ
jgi:hypothetical protein